MGNWSTLKDLNYVHFARGQVDYLNCVTIKVINLNLMGISLFIIPKFFIHKITFLQKFLVNRKKTIS